MQTGNAVSGAALSASALAGLGLLSGVLVALSVPALAQTQPSQPAVPRPGLVEELTRLEHERMRAYISGDGAVLQEQFAPEIAHVNFRGDVTDRAAELSFYGPEHFKLEHGSVSDVSVRDYGNVAVVLALLTWKGATYHPTPDATIDLSGRYRVTRVYVHRNGRWQVAASHASRLPQ